MGAPSWSILCRLTIVGKLLPSLPIGYMLYIAADYTINCKGVYGCYVTLKEADGNYKIYNLY